MSNRKEIRVGSVKADAVGTGRNVPLWAEIGLTDDRLSITWTAAFNRNTCSGFYHGGAMSDTVLDWYRSGKLLPYGAWTVERIGLLAAVGNRWHLNDLKAACVHQRLLGWRYDTHAGRDCPECGYRIGSEWKSEALPDEIREYIEGIISTATESVPA